MALATPRESLGRHAGRQLRTMYCSPAGILLNVGQLVAVGQVVVKVANPALMGMRLTV